MERDEENIDDSNLSDVPEELLRLSRSNQQRLCREQRKVLSRQLHEGMLLSAMRFIAIDIDEGALFVAHIQCADCRAVLDGCYYALMGQFYCERDYNVTAKCFQID